MKYCKKCRLQICGVHLTLKPNKSQKGKALKEKSSIPCWDSKSFRSYIWKVKKASKRSEN